MAIARRSLPARLGLYLAAAIIAVYSAFPIYWMVISSLREPTSLLSRVSLLPGPLTLEAWREGPVRVAASGDIAFADLQFPTPSGRIEIWSDEAAARWTTDPLPGFVEPVESTRERRTPRFPLNLLTPNTKHRIHSQFGNLATMRALEPHPVIALSPADARARRITGGDAHHLRHGRRSLLRRHRARPRQLRRVRSRLRPGSGVHVGHVRHELSHRADGLHGRRRR